MRYTNPRILYFTYVHLTLFAWNRRMKNETVVECHLLLQHSLHQGFQDLKVDGSRFRWIDGDGHVEHAVQGHGRHFDQFVNASRLWPISWHVLVLLDYADVICIIYAIWRSTFSCLWLGNIHHSTIIILMRTRSSGRRVTVETEARSHSHYGKWLPIL